MTFGNYLDQKGYRDKHKKSIENKIKIKKISDLGIIKITGTGLFSLYERIEIYSTGIEELHKNKYQRLLLDGYNTESPRKHSVDDYIATAKIIKNLKLQNNFKTAILGTNDKSKIRIVSVFIKAITGMQMKFFTNHDEAVKWLCEE